MTEYVITITIKQTKSDFQGSHIDTIKTWLKTNVKDKLPSDATLTYESWSINP